MAENQLTPAKAAEELLKRKKARTSLAGYAAYMLEVVPALHHEIICDHIERLLADEWDELIILAPPGSAKSTYTSVALPPYAMGRSPTPLQVLTCSYSTELSEKWGRKIRSIVDSEENKSIFPHMALSDDSKSSGRWESSRGDSLYAAGVGSGILGFRADLAIIDDPISGFEQAQSMTQLGKIHDWYETDFVTRLKPKAKTVLICQRLARNDLAGYLIDRNLSNPTKRQCVLQIKMAAGENDPVGREPGERLWPEWFTEAMVKDAQRDDFKWKTLYQQEPPADTGSWVSTDEIKFAPTPAMGNEYTYYGLTDLALSVGKGDYTVHFIIALHKTTGDCHVADFFRERVDPNVSSRKLVDLAQVYKPAEWLIDDDNASKVFMQLVATEARARNVMVAWKPLPMRGQDKETRAAPLRGMFKRSMIYFDPSKTWTNIVINELLMFPNALGVGVDDCVDALSLIGRRLVAIQKISNPNVTSIRPTIQQMSLNDLWAKSPKLNARIA